MDWIRIDNRLVHGQIIETWLPHVNAGAIIVGNDAISCDAIQQEIMSMAIPHSVQIIFCAVSEVEQAVEPMDSVSLVLFASCADATLAYQSGFRFDVLNVGNLHYGPGYRQLSPSVALCVEDETLLKEFVSLGVTLDFRCVPNDPVQVRF